MNDKNIISSIVVTNILCDNHVGTWNYREIPKVKTQSYILNTDFRQPFMFHQKIHNFRIKT